MTQLLSKSSLYRCVFPRPSRFLFSIFLFLFGFHVQAASAVDIHLRWNPSPSLNTAGYRVYYGSTPGDYSAFEDAGNGTQYTLRGLPAGRSYSAVVRAYNGWGIESRDSNSVQLRIEISGQPSFPGDLDGDGILDSDDRDADGDGVNDDQEWEVSTHPRLRDTDGDGYDDGEELSAGTNPLDRGSYKVALRGNVCSEWNGFFGMFNVAETINQSATPLPIHFHLFDYFGRPRSSLHYALAPGAEFDALVHDMPGRVADSYGTICAVFDGPRAALDGRMVYYKPTPGRGPNDFDFAFALPFSNGSRGPQFVPFNTFQPSQRPADAANLVANWIQLTNLSAKSETGTLQYFGASGQVLRIERVTLEAGRRQDYSAHQFGPWQVGLVGWFPDNPAANFQLRNARYLYDNPQLRESFVSAFQLDGRAGSGSVLIAPLSTKSMSAVLEVSNTTGHIATVQLRLHNSHGERRLEQTLYLAPYASIHVIADGYLHNERGVVQVKANMLNSIVATAMQYSRTEDGGVNFLYGVPAVEAVGLDLHGSYNTFLGQATELWLLNPRPDPQTVIFSVLRFDYHPTVVGDAISVPGNGLRIIAMNDYERKDVYGSLRARPEFTNSIVAWALRVKDGHYTFPTPVR